jgi:hypothetical protein
MKGDYAPSKQISSFFFSLSLCGSKDPFANERGVTGEPEARSRVHVD